MIEANRLNLGAGHSCERTLLSFLPVFAWLVIFASMCGCATTLTPIGEWGRPSDLQLDEESLKGVRVSVRCGKIDEKQVYENRAAICEHLESALADLGAQIINADSVSESELTLWYLDGDEVQTPSVYLSIWGCLYSGCWIPYVSTAVSQAELRVTDGRGVMLDRSPMAVEKVFTFGWPVAFAHASTAFVSGDRTPVSSLERRFIRFARNKVYSHSFRLGSRKKLQQSSALRVGASEMEAAQADARPEDVRDGSKP